MLNINLNASNSILRVTKETVTPIMIQKFINKN